MARPLHTGTPHLARRILIAAAWRAACVGAHTHRHRRPTRVSDVIADLNRSVASHRCGTVFARRPRAPAFSFEPRKIKAAAQSIARADRAVAKTDALLPAAGCARPIISKPNYGKAYANVTKSSFTLSFFVI